MALRNAMFQSWMRVMAGVERRPCTPAIRTLCASTDDVVSLPRPAVPKTLDQLKKEFPAHITMQVQFSELDAMAHVNNTKYFTWFETLRVQEFSSGIEPNFSFTPVGIKPVVGDTWCRFRRPVEMYDKVTVGLRVVDLKPDRGEFKHVYAVWSSDQETVAAMGGCTVVVCDFDQGGRRTAIPDRWLPSLESQR
mmetsp:Transcript_8630/g.22292  ORF Transcript_8630/g.22292 Transcript_8630/m.22292 type:complete len:193 (-) Transcript_8630:220-798(-)